MTSSAYNQGPAVEDLQEALILKQNFPNPFNTSTVISYILTNSIEMSLKVYDIVGREIIALANGFQPAGTYHLKWDGKDSKGQHIPSGVYFYRLEAGHSIKIKQMTVVR